jgi:CRP-like cAMP-binding protein
MSSTESNRLIDSLPPTYRAELLKRMERVSLYVPTSLYRPGETPKFAHFMLSGATSIVVFMENGSGVEVGFISNEGLVETLQLLGPSQAPTTGFLQVDGTALRMPFSELRKEFLKSDILRNRILEYSQVQALIANQLTGCNRLHEVEERLARWLLTVADRLGKESFILTQDFLAQMIGTQRTTVTLAAGSLQRSGLIQYRRGDIHIIDREGLQHAACECYPIVRDLVIHLYDRQP